MTASTNALCSANASLNWSVVNSSRPRVNRLDRNCLLAAIAAARVASGSDEFFNRLLSSIYRCSGGPRLMCRSSERVQTREIQGPLSFLSTDRRRSAASRSVVIIQIRSIDCCGSALAIVVANRFTILQCRQVDHKKRSESKLLSVGGLAQPCRPLAHHHSRSVGLSQPSPIRVNRLPCDITRQITAQEQDDV